ncbi:hypothetical protein BOSEA31B_10943 [Hyphomicrobiales bacterium]|nr:hypothetical protein BOSEA31B_10943 [Hyphomicrobiales bacterium]CAH1700794.1 hypothetical protein BOSEA1005_20493 [Hyphomicrobiales bacterium]CAI0344667.1 hypothetical protein BO1005MUT1_350034 [Hyphomicrobiales bacterium]
MVHIERLKAHQAFGPEYRHGGPPAVLRSQVRWAVKQKRIVNPDAEIRHG